MLRKKMFLLTKDRTIRRFLVPIGQYVVPTLYDLFFDQANALARPSYWCAHGLTLAVASPTWKIGLPTLQLWQLFHGTTDGKKSSLNV
jgi:hypothetical protein